MAAVNASPSGFSYAQAARGHTSTGPSQTPSSKVTSGTATPATGTFSELAAGGNWADDVEATAGEKPSDSRKIITQEQNKSSHPKDSAVERTKSESRIQNSSSGVSSPDLTAASTNTDDSSSVPTGTSSSDTTWETKSQTSEPAWIAERKERQSSAHNEDGGKGRRGKKESKEPKEPKEQATPQAPPKPVVLHDAPPPAVNPWAKRMETAKGKTPIPSVSNKPVAAIPAKPENQRPRADSRKKSNSIVGLAHEFESRTVNGNEPKKVNGSQSKRAEEPRNVERHRSSPSTDEPTSRPSQREHQSLPDLTAVPPLVKDETSWPTPETAAQEVDRRDGPAEKDTKEADDAGDADGASGAKPHQKTKWKTLPVTPTIVWQTEEMNRPRGQGGERGGRGGHSRGGRGGSYRGSANGSKGGERSSARNNGSPGGGEATAGQRGRSDALDREAMPPPAKPVRQASASGSCDRRRAREHSSNERGSQAKPSANGIPGTEAVASAAATAPTFDARRAKSPTKMDSAISDGRSDMKIPEPVHRNTLPSQSEGVRDGSDSTRDNTSVRRAPSDGKKESRGYEGYSGKEWNGTSRGSKRGGRGRGGSREYSNGHQTTQAFANGHGEFAPYGVPQSPSAYPAPRGQFSYPQQGRGGWSRGNPRSQSIPVENVYNGGSRPYWPPHQLAPVSTAYYPGMYDFGGMPMSAVPYNPMVDHQYLMDMVATQLEYYFSLDNLLKDMFLRKHMDSQGFVIIDVIANFNRIKQLTTDKEVIKAVCLKSESIEIRVGEDGQERLRRRQGWTQFLLPVEQREPSAQNEGPKVLTQPDAAQIQFWVPPVQYRGPSSAGIPPSQRRSYDSGYAANGTAAPFAPFSPLTEGPYGELGNGELDNGDEMRGRAAKSPMRETSISPSHQSLMGMANSTDEEPDAFPDEHASSLTVVVKMNTHQSSHPPAATRTFSNGSIDTRSIFSEIEKPTEKSAQPATNGEPLLNGDSSTGIPRHASPGVSRSPDKTQAGSELMLLWVKDKELPTGNLPSDATLEPYFSLRTKALGQREQAATGTCPYDLDVLYQFWSHFLIRNFNNKMYREFKYFAHNDAQERHNTVGLHNLVQLYAKSLASSSPIRDHILKDYVDLVKSENQTMGSQAFKQLRKAWRNGALNLKNRKKLADILDDEIKASLES